MTEPADLAADEAEECRINTAQCGLNEASKMKRRAQASKSAVPSSLKKLLRAHHKWRLENCLNLLASENFSSPAVREMLGTDLTNRYTAPDKF